MSKPEYQAGPDERWVCGACGKYTDLGGLRTDLRDSACFLHAVLCEGEKRADGKWHAIQDQPNDT
jgi:hypothetical protein